MADSYKPADPSQQLISLLVRKVSRLESDFARIEGELADARLELDLAQQAAGMNLPASSGRAKTSASVPRYSTDVAEAAVEILRRSDKIVATGVICAELEKAGFEFESGHPTRAVGHALRQWKLRHGDIFNAGNGLWGYVDNFSTAKIKSILKKHGGMGGRSPDVHGASTSEGMKKAQARGVRIGAKLKFTEDKAIQLLDMIRSGSSIGKACAAINITRACYHQYKDRGLLTWKQGDPWPPRKASTEQPLEPDSSPLRPTLRVVGSE